MNPCGSDVAFVQWKLSQVGPSEDQKLLFFMNTVQIRQHSGKMHTVWFANCWAPLDVSTGGE